jgi:hypothetical protein
MDTFKNYVFVITNTQTGEQFFDVLGANSRKYAKAKMAKELPKHYVITQVADYELPLGEMFRSPSLSLHMKINHIKPYQGKRFVRMVYTPKGKLCSTSTWFTKKSATNPLHIIPDGYTVKVFQI